MRKKGRRKSVSGKGGIFSLKPGIIVAMIFMLGLLMIWKSNRVKDDYSKTKSLEKTRSELIAELSQYRAVLMDLKSISHVGDIAKKRGLTQQVAGRLTIEIPKSGDTNYDRRSLVDMDRFAGWVEEAVLRSGKVDARERDNDSSRAE